MYQISPMNWILIFYIMNYVIMYMFLFYKKLFSMEINNNFMLKIYVK
uniref:ATP synthase F0 subunit 8 n=1 Tax=Amphitetranychus viennensis TaxID=381746 RepID=A0A1L4AHJ8_9ACAR|nr:ATP synthase F0 subunit 8 [Amphitetranychus viennensis]API67779.1 ATP synthase F0 subunit 8 [Amphitetranychus viennensis]